MMLLRQMWFIKRRLLQAVHWPKAAHLPARYATAAPAQSDISPPQII
jgi:hypothetical protein